MVTNFKREVTHSGYKKNNPDKKYYKGIPKIISEHPRGIPEDWLEGNSNFIHLSDKHIVRKSGARALPFVGGGVSLFMIIGGLMVNDTFDEIIGIIVYSLFCILFIFFAIYYFTMPKKEKILNRMDGLITFSGFYWQKNITMTFEDAEFNYTTGEEDAVGAFELQVVRPTVRSFELFSLGGIDCYDDMSIITWYMDKNRPLPPGTAFDPYRQQDFERRKAEGFPKPLYPSSISTPEATKEQQQERYKIGGW